MVSLASLRRKRTAIGLDIGASGVRAAQLTHAAPGFVLTHVSASEWPVEPSGGKDRTPREAARIRGCLRQAGFRGRSVTAALNLLDVEFHALELPAAVLSGDESTAPQVVRYEVGRLSSKGGEGLETRHWALPPVRSPAPNAIAVAAHGEVLARMLDTCTRAGVLCTCVDVAAAALARFGSTLTARKPEDVWGVLDVGCLEARLVLCIKDIPVLVRRAGSGGNTWTERIAASLQLSTKAAEVHKREHGIALSGRGRRHGAEGMPGSDVAAILTAAVRGELKELASEIKRSFEYVLSCYPECKVADLVLVGGGGTMFNLPQFLSHSLGICVRGASDYLDDVGCRLYSANLGPRQRLENIALAVGLAIET